MYKQSKLKELNNKLNKKIQQKINNQNQQEGKQQVCNGTQSIQKVQTFYKQQEPDSKYSLIPKQKKIKKNRKQKDSRLTRSIAGYVWEDQSMLQWPENDYRLFCGNLGNQVTDDVLSNAFRKFRSFAKSKVLRDKRTGKTRGFGFVSLLDPNDFLRAMKQMNGSYIGNRPVKLSKSNWMQRKYDANKQSVLDVQFIKNKKDNKSSISSDYIFSGKL